MIRKGESNKAFRVATDPPFDLSGHDVLTMKFTSPTKVLSSATTPDVTSPVVQVDDPDVGLLQAGTYFELKTTSTTFNEAGEWIVCTVYEITTTTPPTKYFSDDVMFTVGDSC